MLSPFGPGIWIADGAEAEVLGFAYPTRMAVVRLADGGVLLWSPVALTEALRGEVSTLGPVREIVAPTASHHLWLGEWQAAFPGARLHGAPGLARKRSDLSFDSELGDAPDPSWAGVLDQVVIGNRIAPEVVFFHRESATAIFTDLLQCIPPATYSGWRATVARLDRMVGPKPQVPRKFRLALAGRRDAAAALREVLGWPVERVLMAHGAPVVAGGAAVLRKAFGWL